MGGETKQIADVQAAGGFLPNPSLLYPGGPGQPGLMYRNQAVDLSSYQRVLLDPVSILADGSSALNAASPEQRQKLAATFYTDLVTALQGKCQMTTGTGPGTLRLRFALVDASTPNAAVNTVATYTPYVSAAYGLASVAFNNGVGYFSGTATAEFYATDASNGSLVFQAVDKRGGTTALVANTLNNWRDVDHAFQDWANVLATGLQRNGVCT